VAIVTFEEALQQLAPHEAGRAGQYHRSHHAMVAESGAGLTCLYV
jgi:hypothetical protein